MQLYKKWHGKIDNEKQLDNKKIMSLIILYHIMIPKKNKEDNGKKKNKIDYRNNYGKDVQVYIREE